MSKDPFPAAAFGLTEEFTVGDDHFRLTTHQSLEWLRALFSEQYPLSIAPGLLDDASADLISDRLFDEKGDVKWVQRIARSALGCVGGRPWWETERLLSSLGSAHLLGHLICKGVDFERLTVAQAASAVYAALMENQDEKGRFTLDAKISAPPPDAMEEDFEEEDDLAAIALSMRNMPGVSVG